MSTDEDKMIKKLEEHRDATKLVVEIARLHDILVIPTINGDPRGDFEYPHDKKDKLISALDMYLGKYKYIQDDTND